MSRTRTGGLREFNCESLGQSIREEDGRALTQTCGSCGGTRLKVYECKHAEHGPETTAHKCQTCQGYEAKVEIAVAVE